MKSTALRQSPWAIITEHFKNMFTVVTTDQPIIIKRAEMKTPFTADEIDKASKSMKNRKSVGEDGLNAEYVKYGPPEIHNGIAILLNTIAKTGKYPAEIKSGTLAPIPKPGKKQGPPANLRPIILLSIIRKILAICLIRRCWDRLSTRIPIAQSAYQSGRSTTEQVFAIKMLAEKAITSSTYNIYLLLLDMSKAFDTVCRNKLLKDLQEVLEPDEMHMMSILISDVVLTVKVTCKALPNKPQLIAMIYVTKSRTGNYDVRACARARGFPGRTLFGRTHTLRRVCRAITR